ncbi:hypothetical protein COI93_00815 [Bacillus cereus]|uniref:Uncharacterized protein n=1 Tax=Bacillus cereus TaxID=1396 RepID=A0A2B0N3E6_BACCE|nr:hypothetical protein COI93_00815 [Bacillus cereus]
MESSESVRVENQVYSNRVLRSEFNSNWRTCISQSGYVIYIAKSDDAKVEVLLSDGSRKLLVFEKNGEVIVGGGGTSHYSKPHLVINL